MDMNTGEIYNGSADTIRRLADELGHDLVPLTDKQARDLESVPPTQRKNWMRNKPCPCGSGRKFKKCCWSNYT